MANKQNLMGDSEDSKNDRVTLWLEIDVDDWKKSDKVMYRPGDHVGMYATNRGEIVSGLISYLQCDQDPDEPIELQMLKEKHTSTGIIMTLKPNMYVPLNKIVRSKTFCNLEVINALDLFGKIGK